MIYLDSSVALTYLLAEDRSPPDGILGCTAGIEPLARIRGVESRARSGAEPFACPRNSRPHRPLALIELDPAVLARVLEPFPVRVRTLDALHLASIEFLRSRRQAVELLSYDDRLLSAARALRIPLFEP